MTLLKKMVRTFQKMVKTLLKKTVATLLKMVKTLLKKMLMTQMTMQMIDHLNFEVSLSDLIYKETRRLAACTQAVVILRSTSYIAVELNVLHFNTPVI